MREKKEICLIWRVCKEICKLTGLQIPALYRFRGEQEIGIQKGPFSQAGTNSVVGDNEFVSAWRKPIDFH